MMENEEETLDKNLPPHLWREIIEFIPKKNRQEMVSVNSFFYDLICIIDQHELVVKAQTLADEGILRIKRKFKDISFLEIQFIEENIDYVLSILKTHGENVKTLSITADFYQKRVSIRASRLIALLGSVPQLTTLTLDIPKVTFTKWYNHGLLLENVEILTLTVDQNLGVEFAEMFKPNTIKELNVEGIWNQLEHLVTRQENITKLEISEINNPKIFERLKLDSLKVNRYRINVDNLSIMLTSHPELKSFSVPGDIPQFPMTTALVRSVCNLNNLENVFLSLSDEILNDFQSTINLHNLHNLHYATFDIKDVTDDANLMKFANFQLDNTENIYVKDRNYQHMTKTLFLETAGINWRNLKQLEMDMPAVINNDGIDILNEFLDNFPNLVRLDLNYQFVDESVANIVNFSNYQKYPYLLCLSLHSAGINNVQDLVATLPNLRILILSQIDYSPCRLSELLQLEDLKMLFIDFKVDSKFARFDQQQGEELKSLCSYLDKFRITFVSKNLFFETLLIHLANCDNFIDIESTTTIYEDHRLTLKHVEY